MSTKKKSHSNKSAATAKSEANNATSTKTGGSRYFVLYTAILIVIVVALFMMSQQSKGDEESPSLESAPSIVAQPVMGNPEAKVSIVEFGDFKCPSCKAWGERVWPQLKADYVDTGKATFAHINVLFHGEESLLGATASEAMLKLYPEQYWDFHKGLYDAQPDADHDSLWLTDAKVLEVARAAVPELDEEKLKVTMAMEEARQLVGLDEILVRQFGVKQTPTIMINEVKISNPFDYAAIKAAIEQRLK